jgi:DNA-binding transcriptional ArsR family regulator
LPARASAVAPKRSATIFAALGDETRLRLVARLSRGGPASIAQLTEGTRVTRQAVTKHLRVMQKAGLVRSSWLGRESLWRLEAARLAEARRHLEAISTQWDAALARLQQLVENET